MMDQPPLLKPDEVPSREEMAQVAARLLPELAANDPVLAERIRQLQLVPNPAQRRAASAL